MNQTAFSIDRHFARLGNTKYATDKITSFSVTPKAESIPGQSKRSLAFAIGIGLLLLGLGLLVSMFQIGDVEKGFSGLLAFGAGAAVTWRAWRLPPDGLGMRTVFQLMLVTNAGQKAAFETASAAEMKEVEQALERAIVEARR